MIRDEFLLNGDHPILASHQVHGQRLLPGVAYLDILLQFFREAGYAFEQLELRNLSIHRPLIVPAESSVVVSLSAEEKGRGMWRVRMEASEPQPDGQPQLVVVAEAHQRSESIFHERLDLTSQDGKPEIDLEELYAICRGRKLVHAGYSKAIGRIFDLGDHLLVEARLGEDAAHTAGDYLFHPALLDACAIGSGLSFGLSQQEPERLFLPLSYGAFRASQPIRERCWARIAKRPAVGDAEIATFSLELFNAEGDQAGELVNASVKAVRLPGFGGRQRPLPDAGNSVAAMRVAAPKATHTASPRHAMRRAGAIGAERFFGAIFAEQLGCRLEEIDPTLGYYDAGLDSAGLLSLVQRLEAKTGISLSPTLLFEFPTIAQLARHFEQVYPDCFEVDIAPPPLDRASVGPAPHLAEAPAARGATGGTEIAIIGLAGRYPGANTIAAFWEDLKAGKDSVTEVPAARWNWEEFFSWKTTSGKTISRWGGFIDDVDCFDAGFFRISPAEAELIDPQERHFLEVAWSAVEDAGYTPAGLAQPDTGGKRRKVGVFAGVMHKDYMLLGAEAVARGIRVPVSMSSAQIANRVSYHLNFQGPSLVVDTVCSSSLTAVHLALESLRHGECDVALAGGVNLALHPEKYLTYGMLDMHASDGRCRSFGAGGDGYVSSEGVGVVVLKRLDLAVADGDHIYATVKASVVNHVGQVSGITVPSPVAQAEMIAECLEKAGVAAETISYVEAHGTGTALGDPIEMRGLTSAFGAADRPFCALGSVKSNIGHAESAAGISGLSKVILQLHHRTLVATLHSEQSNPLIDFSRTPFFLQRTTEPWTQPAAMRDGREHPYPRRAGLSSFGATGSNAHLILEEYVPAPFPTLPDSDAGVWLVPLSARSPERLRVVVENLLRHLESVTGSCAASPSLDLPALAYTLQVGRVALPHRVVFAVESMSELGQMLGRYAHGERDFPQCRQGHVNRGDRLAAMLGGEAEGKTMISRWVDQGEWAKVAEVWVAGWDLDWLRLYERRRPHRISLPTYPFERLKYWLPREAAQARTPPAAAAPAQPGSSGVLMMEPVWAVDPHGRDIGATGLGVHNVFVCDLEGTNFGAGQRGAGAEIRWNVFTPVAASLDEKFERTAEALLTQIQQIFSEPPSGLSLLQVLVPWAGEADSSGSELFVGLSGITRAAQLENPRFTGQVILVPPESSTERLQEIVTENRGRAADREIRYEQGRRTVLTWRESAAGEAKPGLCWHSDGTYLITGGLGGLGLIFAEEIARQASGVRLILIGRSPLSPSAGGALRRLRELGSAVEYHALDVARPGAMAELIRDLKEKRHTVRGIIHSAGVIRDSLVRQKTVGELREVFAPKVRGLLLLDEATKGLPLDFFVLFSSGAGATGNAGQADYATANGFMDAFAGLRDKRVARNERKGRTISLGWPLWKDGGMRVPAEIEAAMRVQVGIVPMSTEKGLAAFYRAMATGGHRFLIAEGDAARLRSFWMGGNIPDQKKVDVAMLSSVSLGLDLVLDRLKQAFSAVTKYPLAQLLDDEPFEAYGIDSILITQLNHELSGVFSQLPKTVFYEQRTLREMAAYLRREHAADCARWTQTDFRLPELAVSASPLAATGGGSVSTLEPCAAPIAIIGMSGQFPGAKDLAELWRNLLAGRVCVTEIPRERWSLEGFFEPDRSKAAAEGRSYSRWGAFLDGFAEFDAGFFGFSPREALMTDPQERLFLQEAWRAFEDAGYVPSRLTDRESIGVYCGVTRGSFALLREPTSGLQCHTSFASLVNRVSYTFDLRGPSMPVDAMCASASVGIHQACEALRRGEVRMALAGAVNLYLHPQSFIGLARNKLLSGSGTPELFSAAGDGFVPSEGVGAVILKRLDDAERDGDTIHAVIRASAVNHGGKTHAYAVPNPSQQAAVIRKALESAALAPEDLGYIECAANGSEMGDAIELRALQQVFAAGGRATCSIGSVKSLLGHGESVSGLAQLFKVILQLKHRTFCPTRWAPPPDAEGARDTLPFEIHTCAAEWSIDPMGAGASPRRAGINSFGAGGVNAHMIVEEYPAKIPGAVGERGTPVLFVLSARTESALDRYRERWRTHLASLHDAEWDLASAAWRLQSAREAMKHRFACVVASRSELLAALAGGGQVSTHRGVAAAEGTLPSWEAQATDSTVEALERLAAHWVSGGRAEWSRLYAHLPGPPVGSLPAYPFDQKRYWFGPSDSHVFDLVDGVRFAEPISRGPSKPVDEAPSAGARFVPFEALERLSATAEAAPHGTSRITVEEVQTTMQMVLKDLLFHDPDEELDDQASFQELGLSSVFIAPFVQRLAREFGIELRETLVFDYSTINRFSHYIAQRLPLGTSSPNVVESVPFTRRTPR